MNVFTPTKIATLNATLGLTGCKNPPLKNAWQQHPQQARGFDLKPSFSFISPPSFSSGQAIESLTLEEYGNLSQIQTWIVVSVLLYQISVFGWG